MRDLWRERVALGRALFQALRFCPISIIPPILSIHRHLGTAVTRKTRQCSFKYQDVHAKEGNSRKHHPSRDIDSASASQEIHRIL